MTVSGKEHFYQVTNYRKSEAEAYSIAKTCDGYIHSKTYRNGRKRKLIKLYAAFTLAKDKPFVPQKSKMIKLSEMDKVEN